MNGVKGLAEVVRQLAKEKYKEQQAQRGTVHGDRVYAANARSFPFKAVVDVNIYDGAGVWFLLTENGSAIIVGA